MELNVEVGENIVCVWRKESSRRSGLFHISGIGEINGLQIME